MAQSMNVQWSDPGSLDCWEEHSAAKRCRPNRVPIPRGEEQLLSKAVELFLDRDGKWQRTGDIRLCRDTVEATVDFRQARVDADSSVSNLVPLKPHGFGPPRSHESEPNDEWPRSARLMLRVRRAGVVYPAEILELGDHLADIERLVGAGSSGGAGASG